MAKKIMATCDAETDPFSLEQGTDIKPFIWGLYSGKSYHRFFSTQEFVDFVKHKNWNVYAHNGGKFDYMFLLDYLTKADQQEIKIINGRISRFKIGRATFYDSYNILPVPLAKLEKDDFDYSKLHRTVRNKHMPEIEKYLKNDCVYLHKYITEFMEKFNAKITLASTAMGEFEEICATMPESTEEYHDRFSPYYYGGRVSPFEIGVIESEEKKIKFYDINSAYPTAMRFHHPYGTNDEDCVDMGQDLPDGDEYIQNCFIELECDVLSVNGMNQGCFPTRPKKNGGIEFPLGNGNFKVTGWEYLAALKTKAIENVEIKQVWWFIDIMEFSNYVDKFYAEKRQAKQDGRKSDELFSKLMLNSQYGKFCQDSRKFKKYLIVDYALHEEYLIHGTREDGEIADPEQAEFTEDEVSHWSLTRELGDDLCIIETPLKKEHTFYNIATGASITGWVRAFMWESLCKVERPLYCDTDSIACFDGSSLPLGRELGQWDLELENIRKISIAGKKLYACTGTSGNEIKSKLACKGVRLSEKEIERVANGHEVLYRKESPVFSISGEPVMLQRYVNRKDKKKENEEKRKKLQNNAK